MTAEEAYINYLQKAESNGSLDRLSTSRGAFAILYNQVKDRTVMYVINHNYTEAEQYLQSILVSDKELSNEELPSDFLSEQSVELTVVNEEQCGTDEQQAETYRMIPKEKNFYLNNENYKPSFEWREYPYYLSENKVKVLLDNGTQIKNIYLNYYKEPDKIEMQAPLDPESSFLTQDLGLSDYMVERVLSACAGEFKLSEAEDVGATYKQLQNENII